MGDCIDVSIFLWLLAATFALGVIISLIIVSHIRARWEDRDYRAALENHRKAKGGRYTV